MPRLLTAILLVTAASLLGCDEQIGGYVAASSIVRQGFAKAGEGLAKVQGREIRVWGFVDHGNLYGDVGAQQILGDWWGGDGPAATTWRFDLKAEAHDDRGHGIQVRVPNDPGRDHLLRAFVADARTGRPTRVFVRGTLYTVPAPTKTTTMTGLYLELRSSQEVRLEPEE